MRGVEHVHQHTVEHATVIALYLLKRISLAEVKVMARESARQ